MKFFGFGGKPKEVPKTGFMGDTSEEQEKVLAQLKDWVKTAAICNMEEYDDYDYLRFCRARKFVFADVQLMF
jgi:hypothetical protein